jgi:hypothetical protein
VKLTALKVLRALEVTGVHLSLFLNLEAIVERPSLRSYRVSAAQTHLLENGEGRIGITHDRSGRMSTTLETTMSPRSSLTENTSVAIWMHFANYYSECSN